MGMGLLMSGLGALGKSVATSAEAYQKYKDEQDAADKKTKAASDLSDKNNLAAVDLMKQRIALEEEKDNRVREANAAPLKRMGESVSRFANEEVPVTADPVTTSTVAGAQAAGLKNGITGENYADMMKMAQLMPDDNPDKADLINQLQKQQTSDQGIAQKGLLGATRRRTSDEAMAAGRDEMVAKGDLQAVEAGDKANAVTVAGKRQQAQDERNIRQDETNNRKIDAQEAYNQRREERMDRISEMELQHKKSQAKRDDDKATTAEIKEQRAATSKALDGVNADIRSLEKEAANTMLLPQQKDVIDRQLTSARKEAKLHRSALAGAGLDAPDDAPKIGGSDPLGLRAGGSTQKALKSEPAAVTTKEQVRPSIDTSKRDAEMARFNSSVTGSGSQTSNAAKREASLQSEFTNNLSAIKKGMSRDAAYKVFSWFDDHAEDLTPSQQKQAREARRAAGY